MLELYGVPYSYEADPNRMTVEVTNLSSGESYHVGIHHLPLLTSLEKVHSSYLLDRVDALYWEFIRSPRTRKKTSYARQQLRDVKIFYGGDRIDSFTLALEAAGVTLASSEQAAYHLYTPTEFQPELFTEVEKARIVVSFGFHATKISPVLFAPLGTDTFLDRRRWALSFCFQNFERVAPTGLETATASHVVVKQIVDFALERAGYQYSQDICSFLKFDLPGEIA